MGREIVIGVTGGIAAYKTAALVSSLVQRGHGVSVVMTAAAHKFIGTTTFRALTGRPVAEDVFDGDNYPLGPHVELADQAELLCVAPATADFIAKAAHGLADDLLSTLVLSFRGPIIVAPAMNSDMWAKAAVQRNVEVLRADQYLLVDPQEGWLSCRRSGVGRMAEPDAILAVVEKQLENM